MRALALSALLAAPAAQAATDAAEWPHAVTYQIFVRSFADGNDDGIGDLRGLTGKLDYLADLGVKALWLLPVHPSPSYHHYDVTDYFGIHPDYGTMEDFETFLAAAKARGMRVILDLVVNHTSSRHSWFLDAARGPESERFDYYVWKKRSEVRSLTVERTGPDTDNLRRWNEADGVRGRYYYSYFTGSMPDLNFDNPAVRREIYAVGRFWLEKGVDGFRLDAAKHIFPDDRAADTVAFWEEFRGEMEKTNPDVFLVGEVWTDGAEAKQFLPGLRSIFNFEMAGSILDVVLSGRGDGLASRHAGLRQQYGEILPDYIDATFLSNHDQNRVMSVLGDDEERARVAAALLLTLPGSPFIYYGEEIGMRGLKPDPFIREPMLWQRQPDPARPTHREVRHSKESKVTPAAEQAEVPGSLLNHYKSLIRLRNTTPALARGSFAPLEGLSERIVAFRRSHEAGSVLVLHNVSRRTTAVELPPDAGSTGRALWSSSPNLAPSGGKIILPPFSSVVLAD
jgi:alpha-amylase